MYIYLDYPVKPKARYGYGKPPHSELNRIIEENKGLYKSYLVRFLDFKEYLGNINRLESKDRPESPCWMNGWFSGLDAVVLYCFLSIFKPERYIELGCGNSTKFARQAILDQGLNTHITSVDPHPRAEIDNICDRVIREPVEDLELSIFKELKAGDILFVDNSHRVFMNSDVTVVFLDILPMLPPGVLVHFHDIFLPYDYPPEWGARYYSEQYLLAAYLLARGNKCEVVMPNAYISNDPELMEVVLPLWAGTTMEGVQTTGGSFWILTK